MIDQVIHSLEKYAAGYLADLIVFNETFENHLKHIKEILVKLRNAELMAKVKECFFRADNCIYLSDVSG